MKRRVLVCCAILLCLCMGMLCATGCSDEKYYGFDYEWIVGKTQEEIERQYGKADTETEESIHYVIRSVLSERFGKSTTVDLYIYFDEEGKATECQVVEIPFEA